MKLPTERVRSSSTWEVGISKVNDPLQVKEKKKKKKKEDKIYNFFLVTALSKCCIFSPNSFSNLRVGSCW